MGLLYALLIHPDQPGSLSRWQLDAGTYAAEPSGTGLVTEGRMVDSDPETERPARFGGVTRRR